MRRGFTLIELLVTVAIIAVIGAGVAVCYGGDLVDNARREVTLHEMSQIRDAFQRFYSDNSAQVMGGMTEVDASTPLPDGGFSSRFSASSGGTYDSTDANQRLYGMIEFFERYGLWMLVNDSVKSGDSSKLNVQIFNTEADGRKYRFKKPSIVTGEGWRGPYLSAVSVVDCVANEDGGYVPEAVSSGKGVTTKCAVDDGEVRIPQPATKYNDGANGGIYRVVYCEHCADETDGATIYRRLLLMAAEEPLDYDTWEEIKHFTGNRREGDAEHLPIDLATGAVVVHDAQRGVFFMELLNFDTVWR